MPCAFSTFFIAFFIFIFMAGFFLQIFYAGYYSMDSIREIHFFKPSRRCVESIVRYVFVWGHKSSFSRIFILEKGVLRYAIIAATQHTSCTYILTYSYKMLVFVNYIVIVY